MFAKSSNLEGKLIIDGKEFSNLERIYLDGNSELEGVELRNLPELTTFTANNCKINCLEIVGCPKIIHLNVGNNLLNEVGFLNLFWSFSVVGMREVRAFSLFLA